MWPEHRPQPTRTDWQIVWRLRRADIFGWPVWWWSAAYELAPITGTNWR